jgi:AraC-like DNA-binding protein
MLGQFRMRETPLGSIQAEWAAAGKDPNILKNAYLELSYMDDPTVENMLQLFKVIIRFIITNNYIRIRLPKISEKISPWIDKHITEKCGIKAAAEALGLSPSAISHQIKRETGMSFKQFRVLRRVLRFEQVIKSNPDLNIQEAALMAGCEDPLYFSRMYKKTRHITPSEYTRLMRDRP